MHEFEIVADELWLVDNAGGAMRAKGDKVRFQNPDQAKYLVLQGLVAPVVSQDGDKPEASQRPAQAQETASPAQVIFQPPPTQEIPRNPNPAPDLDATAADRREDSKPRRR